MRPGKSFCRESLYHEAHPFRSAFGVLLAGLGETELLVECDGVRVGRYEVHFAGQNRHRPCGKLLDIVVERAPDSTAFVCRRDDDAVDVDKALIALRKPAVV